jgi:hypothetical protein
MTSPIIIDNFMVSQIKACPRKYFWRVEKGLVNMIRPSFAPTFGIAVHKAMEAFYLGGTSLEATRAFLESYIPFWKRFGNPEVSRTPELGVEIVDGFCTQFENDPYKTVEGCVEIGFMTELTPDVLYCGRIDRMVEIGGDVYVLDWKTSSMPWLFCERPNDQGTGYVWGAGEIKGVKIEGVIFDVIHTRATSLKAQKEGTPKWLTDRRISGRSAWEVEEWKETTLHYAGMIKGCQASGVWVKNGEACVNYNQICEYAQLCNSQGVMQDRIMENEYEVSKWEPFEGAMDGGEVE